jgi:hypothetical protein
VNRQCKGSAQGLGSWRSLLVVLLCMATLVCVLMQVASTSNPSIREGLQTHAVASGQDMPITGTWTFATAHENVHVLSLHRQARSGIPGHVLFSPAQDATWVLSQVLPFLGLLGALALVHFAPGRLSIHVLFCGTVPLTVGLFLLLESHILGIPMLWSHWARVLVWLGAVGLHFSAFLFLGRWIAGRVRHLKTAVWIALSLVVALFFIQNSRSPFMRFDGSELPPVPNLPTEVRLSLFRPSGVPDVTTDREEAVDAYLASVDAYSEAVHAIAARRYGLERWWHIASPHLLLDEISIQLLQADHAHVVDALYAAKSGPPSLAASLRAVWPEILWLAVLGFLAAWASCAAARRRVRCP